MNVSKLLCQYGIDDKPNDIKCLRQLLHDVKTAGATLLNEIGAEDRLPTSSEETKLKAFERDAEIAAVEVSRIEAGMDEQRSFHTVGSGYLPDAGHPYGNPSTPRRANGGHRYADMFAGANYIPNNGFAGLNDFLSVVGSGLHHPGLVAVATGMGQEIGGEGGFLIPTEFVSQMLDASLEDEVVRPRADIQRMTSNRKVIAGWDTETHSSNIGGFTGQWLSEGTSATVETGTTRKIELNAAKLAIFTAASNELAADGTDFERQLQAAMVRGIGWHLDDAFLNGGGAGEPKGALNDPALIAVAKDTGQTAATITYTNLVSVMSRLHPASFKNSVWVANSNTIPQLLNLQILIRNDADSDSVGGSHVPALREDGSGGFTLLTRPVIFTEKVPTLGAQGDIVLADFSQYTVGLRPEVGIEASRHAGWAKDETNYRIIIRTDGQGRWSKAVTPKIGATLSWIVAIAVRA